MPRVVPPLVMTMPLFPTAYHVPRERQVAATCGGWLARAHDAPRPVAKADRASSARMPPRALRTRSARESVGSSRRVAHHAEILFLRKIASVVGEPGAATISRKYGASAFAASASTTPSLATIRRGPRPDRSTGIADGLADVGTLGHAARHVALTTSAARTNRAGCDPISAPTAPARATRLVASRSSRLLHESALPCSCSGHPLRPIEVERGARLRIGAVTQALHQRQRQRETRPEVRRAMRRRRWPRDSARWPRRTRRSARTPRRPSAAGARWRARRSGALRDTRRTATDARARRPREVLWRPRGAARRRRYRLL